MQVQIVIGGRSNRLRKLALRDPDCKLADMLLAGRREETSTVQAAEIEKKIDDKSVLAVKKKPRKQHSKTENNASERKGDSPKIKSCFNCGGEYPHKNTCPAKNKRCKNCGKMNHFARQCQSNRRQRNQVRPLLAQNNTSSSDTDSSSELDTQYCYATTTKKETEQPTTKVKIQGSKIKMTVDTGSTINVIDLDTFRKMDSVCLQPTNVKAYPFNSKKPVRFAGKFETLVESKRKFTLATIYVTQEKGGCLMSYGTAEELGLITLHLDSVKVKKAEKQKLEVKDVHVHNIVNNHKEVFTGLGKCKDKQIELVIDESIKPVLQPQRRIPYHSRDKLEKELQKLVKEDIIEKVPENEQAEWVSPVVIVPKKNDAMRLCIDMRVANKAIKRIRHPIPTAKDISIELNGSTIFTKLDLNQAYLQLELSPESRHITTFSTHVGLYRYKRLNYGTNAAAEIFQNTLTQALQGLKGVQNIADDIIVFGDTREEHDAALKARLKRLEEKGLTLNFEKCQFLRENLNFFGLVYSKEGIHPDPKKIAAFVNTSVPKTVSEVRSLLGMANYSSQFIPNFASITEPLRQLTRKDSVFTWGKEQEKAYKKLKKALTTSPVMSYFGGKKDTVLYVDASLVGVSAILAQREPGTEKEQVVSYGSRSLTSVEKRYSQTEKEGLAIVWGIEHFHLFCLESHSHFTQIIKP